MDTVIVLAMHGAPPNDFPRQELGEFFGLHERIARVGETQRPVLRERLAELDRMIRDWPRTAQNDPFFAGSRELADALARASGLPVRVGFNEFCSPSLEQALDDAAQGDAERIVVVTPMMTRGGEHAEHDIRVAIRDAQARHPGVAIDYAWPFATVAVAEFLAQRVGQALDSRDG